jgi:hypothetical protein
MCESVFNWNGMWDIGRFLHVDLNELLSSNGPLSAIGAAKLQQQGTGWSRLKWAVCELCKSSHLLQQF